MDAIFLIIFIIVAGGIIFSLVQGVVTWNKNNQSPILTIYSIVISKRENTSQHQYPNAGDVSGAHGFTTTTNTSYYVTFQMENGEKLEFSVPSTEYKMLVEGDTGQLTFQGTRYLSFEK